MGSIWGLSLMSMCWLDAWIGYGHAFMHVVASVYIGVAPTLLGGFIGLIWGLVDGFVFAWLIAFVYNRVAVN